MDRIAKNRQVLARPKPQQAPGRLQDLVLPIVRLGPGGFDQPSRKAHVA